MKNLLALLIILCAISTTNKAQSIIRNEQSPKHEVRAVWLATIGGLDWPHSYSQSPRSAEKQKQELCAILDQLQAAKFNTVLLQTRIRGTMIYPSEYEPWDGCLSGFPGKTPRYDALQLAIDECHKRGMELHAWIVTIPVGKWNDLGCKRLRSRFPKLIRQIGPDGYMNPEDARTADYLASICKEIVQKYQVDGIHLDYIRYPETWNKRTNGEQGRANITRIVRKIHDAVKQEKPWVKMSCAPIGKFDDLSRYESHGWNAYSKVFQDAQKWLRNGMMDQLYPMMYFRGDQFFPFAINWQEMSYGKTVVPGLGIYFLDPKEGKWSIGDVTSEMYHIRNLGQGYAFFRSKFLMDNRQGIYDFTAKEFNRHPALIPAMTWICDKQPATPCNLQIKNMGDYTAIIWKNLKKYEDNSAFSTPYIYNNVYASRTYPVDITDARNLIATRLTQDTLLMASHADDRQLYYAVTAMDSYGNESLPIQSFVPGTNSMVNRKGVATLIKNNGKTLVLPKSAEDMDCNQICIETLQGQRIRSIHMQTDTLDISNIPDGIYRIKAITPYGVHHILGTLRVKQ